MEVLLKATQLWQAEEMNAFNGKKQGKMQQQIKVERIHDSIPGLSKTTPSLRETPRADTGKGLVAKMKSSGC